MTMTSLLELVDLLLSGDVGNEAEINAILVLLNGHADPSMLKRIRKERPVIREHLECLTEAGYELAAELLVQLSPRSKRLWRCVFAWRVGRDDAYVSTDIAARFSPDMRVLLKLLASSAEGRWRLPLLVYFDGFEHVRPTLSDFEWSIVEEIHLRGLRGELSRTSLLLGQTVIFRLADYLPQARHNTLQKVWLVVATAQDHPGKDWARQLNLSFDE